MNETIFLSCFAIGAIVVLMGIALLQGMNGTLLTGTVGLIAGIAGYTFKGIKDKVAY